LNKDLIIQLQEQQLRRQELFIIDQAKQITDLLARIVELENNQKKNSGNSSKPPSTDIGKDKRTKSLRGISDKKAGGQPGHEGKTLERRLTVDKTVVHAVKNCSECGKDLRSIGTAKYESRQVFDLPPIKLSVTEHQSEIKYCPCCQTVNQASFPKGVTQPVQYGVEIQKLAVYFNNYQLLPYKRTSKMFEDLLGHRVSEASLVSMNQRCANNLAGFTEVLKEILIDQPVLNADETGYYYNGDRNWLHVITTEKHTQYMPHAKRGVEAMDAMGILLLFKGTLVHDFWKPYNQYACDHSLCNIHHLRDLTFCEEVEKSTWAAGMIKYLLDTNKKVSTAKEEGKTALSKGQLYYWNKKYDELIETGWNKHPPPKKQNKKRGVVKKSKTQNMIQRFEKYKGAVLAFMNDFRVPFGNNLAEQAIRMMKVKQKISGCFRSEQGAKTFATIRSYISTMQKQGIAAIDALHAAINGSPYMPTA